MMTIILREWWCRRRKIRRVVGVRRIFTHPNAGSHAVEGSDIVLLQVESLQWRHANITDVKYYKHISIFDLPTANERGWGHSKIWRKQIKSIILNSAKHHSLTAWREPSVHLQPGLFAGEGPRLHRGDGLGLRSVLPCLVVVLVYDGDVGGVRRPIGQYDVNAETLLRNMSNSERQPLIVVKRDNIWYDANALPGFGRTEHGSSNKLLEVQVSIGKYYCSET